MTWRELIAVEMVRQKDDLLIMIEGDLDQEVSSEYGTAIAEPVMAWSNNLVYFSCENDGLEMIRSVPRHPKSIKFQHLTLYVQ